MRTTLTLIKEDTMAILKIKKLIEDIENNTSLVLGTVTKVASTAANAGTAAVATTASYTGTARVAHFMSSGTASLYGTSAFAGTGM